MTVEYLRRLNKYSVDEAGLENLLKNNYSSLIGRLTKIKAGDIGWMDVQMTTKFIWMCRSHLFKLGKTKKMFADTYRACIKDLTKYYCDVTAKPIAATPSDNIVGKYVTGNPVGQIWYNEWVAWLPNILEQKCMSDVRITATKIVLALRCYKNDHGGLPKTLDELVPEYLDSVPIDSFDGKPMRYSKEKKIIYSIGKDLIDSGGKVPDEEDVGRHDAIGHKDPTFVIGF